MKVWLIACALVAVIIGDTLALRFSTFGDLNFAHTLLTFFSSEHLGLLLRDLPASANRLD